MSSARNLASVSRAWALAAALALVAAGCGSSDSGDGAEPATAPAAESGPEAPDDQTGAAASPDPSPEPGSEPDAAPAPADGEPLVVSFIVTDVSVVAQALGWEVPDQGDLEAAIEAVAAHVNAAGGFGGRPIQPVVRVFNAITDSPISEEQLCNAITQDDQAEVVVLTGQFQDNARPCYAAAGTLMLDVTLYPVDRAGYQDLAPYLWSPLLPSYDDLVAGLAQALESSDWLTGATVGVVGIDNDMNRRMFDQVLSPRLDAAGAAPVAVNWVDPADGTTLEAGQQQAILDFKSAGVNKVISLGGSRLASWMMDIGATQNFSPAYAISSYDSPEFNIRNTPDLMAGSLGISVLPGWDVADDQHPSPANDAEAMCLEVLSGAGLSYESRANSRTALLYCDALQLLQLAGETAASSAPSDIGSAMRAIGDSFEPASVYSVAFSEDSFTGAAGYRIFAFDESCECMVIHSDTVPFQ